MTEAAPVVHIVDDDDRLLGTLKRLVESVGLAAQTFASAKEFLACGPPDGPACLVLDVRLPGLSGLDLQRELADTNLRMPIIFISGFGDVPMTARAMKAGAVDFLQKPFNDQDLLDAIRQALDRDRRDRRERAEQSEIHERAERLSPREREVFALVVAGLANKQIARRLGTSEKTVKVHRGRVMQKMQADSLAGLVRMAEKAGIEVPKV